MREQKIIQALDKIDKTHLNFMKRKSFEQILIDDMSMTMNSNKSKKNSMHTMAKSHTIKSIN